nr:MAG TPA: hypothetical protein [Caudoviricetes sp.]
MHYGIHNNIFCLPYIPRRGAMPRVDMKTRTRGGRC